MGFAEYRDHEWDTLEDFKKSDVFLDGKRTEEWFLERNFGGTYYLIDDLFDHGLVEIDGESWHLTYFVTNLGKTVLNNAPDVIKSVCKHDYMRRGGPAVYYFECTECGKIKM